jgi:hypothetical protein
MRIAENLYRLDVKRLPGKVRSEKENQDRNRKKAQ